MCMCCCSILLTMPIEKVLMANLGSVHYVYVLCCSILLTTLIENMLVANVGRVFIMCMCCFVASC